MENIAPQSFNGPQGEKNLQNHMCPHEFPNRIMTFWVSPHKSSISQIMTLELSYLGKGFNSSWDIQSKTWLGQNSTRFSSTVHCHA